jgi:transketolase
VALWPQADFEGIRETVSNHALDWTSTDERAVDLVRVLAMDAVQEAGNGHPGTAMSLAPAAYLLYQRILRHDPADPHWTGRDRFVLSCGHSSLTLYIQLYLSGYALSLDDLKKLRKWGSITPGHPEYHMTPGVEITTGPLGQGVGNAVGMAMAARRERGLFDPDAAPGTSPFDHYIYAFASDGDIEEGITHESSALAAVQELGNLTLLYDDNYISIEDDTHIAKSEDVGARYEAYGWHVQHVDWHTADGGYHENVQALYDAFEAAKAVTNKPSLIVLHTIIGWPAPNKKNTGAAHGSALGDAEVAATKEILGFDPAVKFPVEEEALSHAREVAERGKVLHAQWDEQFAAWEKNNGERASLFARMATHSLPAGWTDALPGFPADPKGIATRKASGDVLTALAPVLPELWGGSADLAESNLTTMKGEPSFLPANRQTQMWPGNPYGRTLHFGIREHGMGSILNGIAVHGGTRVYGGTFLQFSDYMRGAVRLAALMEQPVIYVWTHDSIGLGEDGRPDPPADRAPVVAAEHPRLRRRAARGRQRNRGRLAGDSRADRPAGRPVPEPAEHADVRPVALRAGRGGGTRRVRAGRRDRRDLDRDRIRGADRRGRARAARRAGHLRAGRLHAVHGMVCAAGRFLPRERSPGGDEGPGVGRGRHHGAVEDLRR